MDESQATLGGSEGFEQPGMAASMAARVLVAKHPLAIRWFHWINFPILFFMIWSGELIYWANRVFTVSLFGHKFGPLFPDSWYAPHALQWMPQLLTTMTTDDNDKPYRAMWSINGRLAEGMGWHFLFAWFFAINGVLYVLYLLFSGEWRTLAPRRDALKESLRVVLLDLHLIKGKLPIRKYNAAQQIAYTGVIAMGFLMLVTGIAIYKPSEQSWLTRLVGGYTVARFIHFWITNLFLAFFLVHVGQVVRTGWNNFRGMITGFELVSPEEKAILGEKK
jgi:thiosulfate reductase cytochrome b subunit